MNDFTKDELQFPVVPIMESFYRMPLSEVISPIRDSAEMANKRVTEFAKKFVEQNKDLLKKWTDR